MEKIWKIGHKLIKMPIWLKMTKIEQKMAKKFEKKIEKFRRKQPKINNGKKL